MFFKCRNSSLAEKIFRQDYVENLNNVLEAQQGLISLEHAGISATSMYQHDWRLVSEFKSTIRGGLIKYPEIEDHDEYVSQKNQLDELIEDNKQKAKIAREKYEKKEADRIKVLEENREIVSHALPVGSKFEWADIDYQVISVNLDKSRNTENTITVLCAYKTIEGCKHIEQFTGTELAVIVKQQQDLSK